MFGRRRGWKFQEVLECQLQNLSYLSFGESLCIYCATQHSVVFSSSTNKSVVAEKENGR